MCTKKYIPLNKRSKREQKAYYASKRNTWGSVNPAAKTFLDKRGFSKAQRAKDKARLRSAGRRSADGGSFSVCGMRTRSISKICENMKIEPLENLAF